MKKIIAIFIAFAFCMNMKAQQTASDRLNIILDTDIGSSTDDLFALDMLYKYMDEGKANLLAIMIDREGDVSAAMADVLNTWYGYPDIPIGVTHNSVKNPRVFIDYSVIVNKTETLDSKGRPSAKGKTVRPYFKRTLSDEAIKELPEAVKLYRKILAEQPDRSVVVCAIGFLTNLAQLLNSPADEYSPLTGRELVARKVKQMYSQGGVFYSSEEPDYNVLNDIPSGKMVYEEWPTPIIYSPMEVGNEIDYPAKPVLADLADYAKHPLKTVYEECETNTGQRMWDQNTVIQAVEGNDFYTMSQPGYIKVTPKGGTAFTPSLYGNRSYQITNRQQSLALYSLIREKTAQAPKNLIVP